MRKHGSYFLQAWFPTPMVAKKPLGKCGGICYDSCIQCQKRREPSNAGNHRKGRMLPDGQDGMNTEGQRGAAG